MRRFVIAVHGDNEELHKKALKAAVEAIERVNKTPVYRAWMVPEPEIANETMGSFLTALKAEQRSWSKPSSPASEST